MAKVAVEYAGFWLRFAASIVDGIILGLVSLVIYAPYMAYSLSKVSIYSTNSLSDTFTPLYFLTQILSFVVGWLYFAVLESSGWQATVGKRVVGIIVTDLNGERISFLRATGRHLAKILSTITLCIGYLMIGFTEKKQGLHDIIASCLVVKGKGK